MGGLFLYLLGISTTGNVCVKDVFAKILEHAATLRLKAQIIITILPSHTVTTLDHAHLSLLTPGAGIMEADDRQVTTVFTVQPSFHHRHSTNRVS